jgi:hypothetical protein
MAAYYDQIRRQQEAERQGYNADAFKSPHVIGFDQYWDYGQEHETASANYRPRNSNTCLRKPRARISSGKPYVSQVKVPQVASEAKSVPKSEEESQDPGLRSGPLVEFSPINDRKYSDEGNSKFYEPISQAVESAAKAPDSK